MVKKEVVRTRRHGAFSLIFCLLFPKWSKGDHRGRKQFEKQRTKMKSSIICVASFH